MVNEAMCKLTVIPRDSNKTGFYNWLISWALSAQVLILVNVHQMSTIKPFTKTPIKEFVERN